MSRQGRGEDTRSQEGFFTTSLRENDSKDEAARKSCISGENSTRSSKTTSADNVSDRTPVTSNNCPHNCQNSNCCHCLRI